MGSFATMGLSRTLRGGAALALGLLCGGCGPSESGTSPGGGTTGGSGGAVSSGGHGGHGGHGGTGGATGGVGGGAPEGPHLSGPQVVDVPYVVAGTGGSAASVTIVSSGDTAVTGIQAKLTGSAILAIEGSAPLDLSPGEPWSFQVTFDGAATETIESASLEVAYDGGSLAFPVFAVAGDAGLEEGDFADVTGAGGVVIGQGITLSMPAAPYPKAGAPYTDDHVRIFLPEGYRDIGAQDTTVHFHGHSTTLAATLSGHHYQEHVYASGANAVLVAPQGPVNAASGDFGKLMDPGGLSALTKEVLEVLYREGKIKFPVLGDLTLTSHSGGYWAAATNLMPSAKAPPVRQVDLFDSLYGFEGTYQSFAVAGGVLRSNYTQGGGTLDNNLALVQSLGAAGLPPVETFAQRALLGAAPVVYFADTSHSGSTRMQGAYGEQIRFGARHHRHGPRVELREAVAQGGSVEVKWLSPQDADLLGFAVEVATDGVTWAIAAEVGPGEDHASIATNEGARVRVRPYVFGLETWPSDEYRADPAPKVLVVDGFDRVIDGGFGGLRHDLAAIGGEALSGVATVSNEAVGEDGFDLSTWPLVVWLSGDQSTGDVVLTPNERAALLAYVDGGGRLVMAGSEIAYSLSATPEGADFLAHCFGATYAADSSGSYSVAGTGPLAAVSSFPFAGPGAAYVPGYPDVLGTAPGGEILLRYATNQPAAVGVPGQSALVGFPIELTDDPAAREALFSALAAYVQGP